MAHKSYSTKELQHLYDNQKGISALEWTVLNVAMWDRARRANYHGYAKDWGNIEVTGNVVSVVGCDHSVQVKA